MNERKSESKIVVAAQVKVEILLWLAVASKILTILVFQPLKMQNFKEIFMAMNVDLPVITSLILSYSDFISAWYPIAILLLAGGLFAMYRGAKLIIVTAANETDGETRARFELWLSGVLVISFLMLQFAESAIQNQIMAPMLGLVNAI